MASIPSGSPPVPALRNGLQGQTLQRRQSGWRVSRLLVRGWAKPMAGRTLLAPPLVEMRGISKRFGPVQAVAGVDLTLNQGDILGLLGENGAGKTSLMNVLFGTYAADAGE